MKRPLLITYLVALHVLAAALLWRSSIPERLGLRSPGPHPHIVQMRAILSWRDMTTPNGAAVLLGDSLTERLAGAAVAPDAVNLAIGRQRTDHLLRWFPEAATRARMVYLLIGTNDYLQGRAAGIEDRLQAIAQKIPPDVGVVWTGIMLPEAGKANGAIQRLCAARPRCAYVPPLTEPALFADGVHLNLRGYREWIDRLRKASL
jgi:lysophospholipase L1-like esterase